MAGVLAFFAAGVFAQSHVANPVLAFDPPVTAVERQQFCSVGLLARQTGDRENFFVSYFALFAHRPLDAADLL